MKRNIIYLAAALLSFTFVSTEMKASTDRFITEATTAKSDRNKLNVENPGSSDFADLKSSKSESETVLKGNREIKKGSRHIDGGGIYISAGALLVIILILLILF